jgi:Rps23 Pro-64 3,4-dihydroxylase Tpa1-like proline 4-hydroxylase
MRGVYFFFFIFLLRIKKKDSANAFSSSKSPSSSSTIGVPATTTTTTTTSSNNNNNNNNNLISSEDINKIALGGVAVISNFVPTDLVNKMRNDAISLQSNGYFRADGLSNKALGSRNDIQKQGFTPYSDRQTFRGTSGGWYNTEIGDYKTRNEFDQLMSQLRKQLAIDLNRPTLITDEQQQQQQQQQQQLEQKVPSRHEISYNWYEPTAKLGQHLDEHHEETKGPQGWKYPTRRSITWLVYLNDEWTNDEGGSLRCLPRRCKNTDTNTNNNNESYGPIGSHEGNIQIGWMDGYNPVYLDAFRDSGQTALYSCQTASANNNNNNNNNNDDYKRIYWSKRDFDVPAQPIEFEKFVSTKNLQSRFEQISMATAMTATATTTTTNQNNNNTEEIHIIPSGGTIVLFDSVTLPHSVLEVTGKRQRIAATGWFHEDSQFTF